jgi:hypothetical protein
MKLELTETEVQECILALINQRFDGVFNTVELDIHYGIFNKAILSFVKDDEEVKENE